MASFAGVRREPNGAPPHDRAWRPHNNTEVPETRNCRLDNMSLVSGSFGPLTQLAVIPGGLVLVFRVEALLGELLQFPACPRQQPTPRFDIADRASFAECPTARH